MKRKSPAELHVYVTSDQKKRALQCAEHLGISLTQFVRDAIMARLNSTEILLNKNNEKQNENR